MNNHHIAEILVDKGKALYNSPKEFVEFTGNVQADTLLNDLENTPHAFVLACVMDRQIKAELAWLIPYLISEKLGNFEFQTLVALSLQEVEKLMTTLPRCTVFRQKCQRISILQFKRLPKITAV